MKKYIFVLVLAVFTVLLSPVMAPVASAQTTTLYFRNDLLSSYNTQWLSTGLNLTPSSRLGLMADTSSGVGQIDMPVSAQVSGGDVGNVGVMQFVSPLIESGQFASGGNQTDVYSTMALGALESGVTGINASDVVGNLFVAHSSPDGFLSGYHELAQYTVALDNSASGTERTVLSHVTSSLGTVTFSKDDVLVFEFIFSFQNNGSGKKTMSGDIYTDGTTPITQNNVATTSAQAFWSYTPPTDIAPIVFELTQLPTQPAPLPVQSATKKAKKN